MRVAVIAAFLADSVGNFAIFDGSTAASSPS